MFCFVLFFIIIFLLCIRSSNRNNFFSFMKARKEELCQERSRLVSCKLST